MLFIYLETWKDVSLFKHSFWNGLTVVVASLWRLHCYDILIRLESMLLIRLFGNTE